MREFFEFHGVVNCYLELNGMHRFREDMQWGHLLRRFREGKLTESDIDSINERHVYDDSMIPQDIRYATYRNKDRAAINAALFDNYIQNSTPNIGNLNDAVAIFASNLRVSVAPHVYRQKDNAWEEWFFDNCSEGNCDPTDRTGRFDPVLLLYNQRPVMLNTNLDVHANKANGTLAKIRQLVLKDGEAVSHISMHGKQVPAVRAIQVKKLILEHEHLPLNGQRFLELEPIEHTFNATVPLPASLQFTSRNSKKGKTETIKMKASQLPIVCNNATTGHKLQGSTMPALFVHTNSVQQNWMYVVLSRVTKKTGLYLPPQYSQQ